MDYQKLVRESATFCIIVFVLPVNCFAAGSGMPWEGALYKIMDSCTGPVAMVLGALAILSTGLGIAFGEGGGLMRKALNVVFGLSICFTAGSFGLKFFGFGGGIGFGG